jgi:hypothetical protein
MEWMPGKEEKLAKYKDSARHGHEIAFVTKERLLRAAGHDLRNAHFFKCDRSRDGRRSGYTSPGDARANEDRRTIV